MGLIEKAKAALIRREAKHYLAKLQAWVEDQRRRPMVFLKALGVAFLGGAASAASDALLNGTTFDKAGMLRLGATALAGGLIAAAAYLKQSPIKPALPPGDGK